MRHAWSGYMMNAFGKDEVSPVSGGYKEKWGGLATTLVDSLETLWIMDMKVEFYKAKDWIAERLDFHKNVRVSVFETTIRSLGGLLSAYDWSGESIFLEKAEDLGRRLLRAFDGAMMDIPFGNVNLKTGTNENNILCLECRSLLASW